MGTVILSLAPLASYEEKRWGKEHPRRAILLGSRGVAGHDPAILRRQIGPNADYDMVASASFCIKYLSDNAPRITNITIHDAPLDPALTGARCHLIKLILQVKTSSNDSSPPASLDIELPWRVSDDGAITDACAADLLEYADYSTLKRVPIPGSTSIRAKQYNARVPPLELLLAVKETHTFAPAAWHKHVADVHAMRAALPQSLWPSHNARLGKLVEVRFKPQPIVFIARVS